MKLKWIGRPEIIGVPDWPACDHDEPEAAMAEAKLASGLYIDASDSKKKEEKE